MTLKELRIDLQIIALEIEKQENGEKLSYNIFDRLKDIIIEAKILTGNN